MASETMARVNGKTALVLGATGGIGGEVARRLLARGWRVRALHRRAGEMAARGGAGLEWHQGDAMVREEVRAAARGVSLIVHAVNPPGYRRWEALVLPMIDNTIAAAEESGARVVLPGTVYNFGPDVIGSGPIAEGAAQRPVTKKGAIRVRLEASLEEAAARGAARALIVRAGDFFGPEARSNWLAGAMIKADRPLGRVLDPTRRAGVGHQWGYVPDVAEAMVRLAEREAELGAFERFHMAGHWDADGRRMIAALGAVAAAHGAKVAVGKFPWWAVAAGRPVVGLFRELWEMRYLWEEEVRLDGRRLAEVLGEEPHTPWEEAVRATLVGLGCVRAQATGANGAARALAQRVP